MPTPLILALAGFAYLLVVLAWTCWRAYVNEQARMNEWRNRRVTEPVRHRTAA